MSSVVNEKVAISAATDHVDFQVKRGEIFGLLGPNGAGKSTTSRDVRPAGAHLGKALVLGMDLKVSSGKARQHLGYMAQKLRRTANPSVELKTCAFFSGVYGLRGSGANEKSPG
ncbi:ATP-binding cassette domain-containing protein [Klebsiella pneumoniae]|nr:ATP-binding cassette domain-containing protein [Klebsiella pneumoniae]